MVEEFAEQTAVEIEDEGLAPIVAQPASTEDAPLTERVADAIWHYYPARATVDVLRVTVERGVVSLAGVVRTDAQKLIVGDTAARVDGVRVVRNGLISDDEIARAVGRALGTDIRTREHTILVRSLRGEVRLAGKRPDLKIVEAAASLARQVAGVADVVIDFTGD